MQLFESAMRLYFRQVSFVNLSSHGEVDLPYYHWPALPTSVGARGAAEASADYDGGAAEGENLDEALRLRVGYTW